MTTNPLTSSLLLAALFLAASPSAWSADDAAAAERHGPPEPAVQRTVIDGRDTRVEELRVRGKVVHITVQPKNPKAPAYEIVPADPGRDPSSIGHSDLAGQRVWRVMSF